MRFLVVDDSETVRIQLDMIIHHLYDATVVGACNGLDALNILKDSEEPFDLILCDINMPVMGGFEFMKRIKEEKLTEAPVVIITTETKTIKNMGRDLGAKAWITKPFEQENIEEVIEVLLKRKSKQTA